MFTKQDYIKYFLQIKETEENMGAKFLKCAEKLEDPEMKKIFLQFHKEETAHSKVADALLKMFENK